LSTGKIIKVKSILVGRIRKWTVLAIIGCSAYFAGYIWGHKNIREPAATRPPIILPTK
jgi:hypothetical protein